jgi:hypothetical protein
MGRASSADRRSADMEDLVAKRKPEQIFHAGVGSVVGFTAEGAEGRGGFQLVDPTA